jgi:hypothetical protein
MLKSRTLVNLVTILVIAGAGILGYHMWRGQPAEEESHAEESGVPATPTPQPDLAEMLVQPAAAIPVTGTVMVDIARRWEQAHDEKQEANRDQKLREISEEVVAGFGLGGELLAYLDFLAASGAMAEREWLLTAGLRGKFAGSAATEARAWLLTVKEEKLRERLSRQAGECFEGQGFKEYFEKMGEVGGLHCQAALLTGYCVTLAKADPDDALRIYKELAYPKRIDNTGMAHLMKVFPVDSDFLKYATEIKEDSMTLAKRARASLLDTWARTKPADAADYVIRNAGPVHSDQMKVVVKQWIKTSPDAAAEWLAQAAAGPARDQGMAELARYWQSRNPENAWSFVKQVADPETRQTIAAGVVFEWRKSDPAAADGAWSSLSANK